MKYPFIPRSVALPLFLGLLFSTPLALSAQQDGSNGSPQDGTNGPPKVLVMQREFLKPGKAGSTHEKSESAFVRAMAAAKWPTYYFAMDSLSGPSRSLFFTGYPSFEAWEKDTWATRKNATLSAALDRAANADGELLSEYDSHVLALREDLSLNLGNLVGMRYMEISRFVVRPGHMKDFEELAKLYVNGYKKSVPTAHWVTFELMYGVDSGSVFLVISPLKSLAETDRGIGESKQFTNAMGESGMKKLSELTAACIASAQTNLFEFNPKNSYPPPEWIKAEPDFWKPKVIAAKRVEPKTEAKPAQ
jgi:hypothetical protein